MRVEALVKVGQPKLLHRYTSSLESIPESWFENPRPAPSPPGAFAEKPLPPLPEPHPTHKKSDSDELRRQAILRCAHEAEERRISLEEAADYLGYLADYPYSLQ